MALYRCKTEAITDFVSIEAVTKAEAIKTFRDLLNSQEGLKEFTTHVTVERLTVVRQTVVRGKVRKIKCPVCEIVKDRKEFMEHVRTTHVMVERGRDDDE